MMEEVLLSVATVGAEVFGGKPTQATRGHLAFAREIDLSKDALDPDVDGEGAKSSEAEEQCAVRDFFAHTGEATKFRARFVVGHLRDFGEIDFAIGQHARGTEEILSTEAEPAI